jgi:NADPH:quinone reductase-like Zn-dependent oxidoreductase
VRSVQVDRLSDGLDRVQLGEAPIPEPGPGQLRVGMRLSPVNPSDLNFIRGDYARALERLIWNQGQEVLCYDPGQTQPSPTPRIHSAARACER